MSNFDELRFKAIARAVDENTEVEEACEAALKEMRKLPGFDEWVLGLAMAQIRQEVHNRRSNHNHTAKGEFKRRDPNPPRGNPPGRSQTLNALLTLDNYYIGATVMGKLTGKELREMIDAERGRAEGHMNNVRVMERILPRVGVDDIVKDKVSNKFFQQVLKDVFGNVPQAAAG